MLLLGTSITDPVLGKGTPERWWFKLRVKRDDNPRISDMFWVTGLVSNLDNFANNRIKEYVKKGRMAMVEGVVQQWNDKDGKPYLVILAKLVRVEIYGGEYPEKRLLHKVLRKEKRDALKDNN